METDTHVRTRFQLSMNDAYVCGRVISIRMQNCWLVIVSDGEWRTV